MPPVNPQIDPYYKKTVMLELEGQPLRLAVSQELFSSHEVDRGSRLLIRSLLAHRPLPFTRILDLGCGYGPIGLALKNTYPDCSLDMVDRDALAVGFAAQNARRNRFSNVKTYGSLIYDDIVDTGFDLVASNIPGKGSFAFYRRWLLGARHYLAPRGVVAAVIVRPLATTVRDILARCPEAVIRLDEDHASHSVLYFDFQAGNSTPPDDKDQAFISGIFDRSVTSIDIPGLRYEIQAVYGLAEFDSLSFPAVLAIDCLRDLPRGISRAICMNPGQGHLPIAAWRLTGVDSFELVDRDLLALRTSQANLVRNGFPAEGITVMHDLASGPMRSESVAANLYIDFIRPREPAAATRARLTEGAVRLASGGYLVVAGTSTAITRAVAALRKERRVVLAGRRRRSGYSAAVFVHR
jgi:16S rRNA (guanine1207-N2)-methyltransferase